MYYKAKDDSHKMRCSHHTSQITNEFRRQRQRRATVRTGRGRGHWLQTIGDKTFTRTHRTHALLSFRFESIQFYYRYIFPFRIEISLEIAVKLIFCATFRIIHSIVSSAQLVISFYYSVASCIRSYRTELCVKRHTYAPARPHSHTYTRKMR